MRKVIAASLIAAVAAGSGFTGYALHSQAGVPASCRVAGSSLPSGDAARLGSAEFVCTGGTWVHVAQYGNVAAPHHVDLRYNPDGVQLTCPRSELGWTATISGDGHSFAARCDSDGPRLDVWDAAS